MSAFGLGSRESQELDIPSPNHCKTASLNNNLQREIEKRGLTRVAGNAFVCQSTKDFWTIRGNKLIRLTVEEVDNGESLAPAPAKNPANFLDEIMNDLTF